MQVVKQRVEGRGDGASIHIPLAVADAVFDGMQQPVNGTVTMPEGSVLGFTPNAGILELKVE